MNSNKKYQVILCFLAGVGLFLPLVKISAYDEKVNITFMQFFAEQGSTKLGIIDGRIVLGIIILAFVMLLICFKKNTFTLNLISLLIIIAAGVLFYIDVDKLSVTKSLLSSMIKYSFGYYISLAGIAVSAILGLVDIISNRNSNRDYEEMERILDSYHTNNSYQEKPNSPAPINNNQSNSLPGVNNTTIPPDTSSTINQSNNLNTGGIKLSELVNLGETTNNNEQDNSINDNQNQ